MNIYSNLFPSEEPVNLSGPFIGPRIRYLREQKNMSRKNLALLFNVQPDTLKKYENGDLGISIDILRFCRQTFHCGYAFLIDGENLTPVDQLLEQINILPVEEKKKLAKELIDSL